MQQIDPKVNPWISMWTQPQKTIKAVISINPNMGFFFLSSIWFLQLFFLFESYFSLKFSVHWLLMILIAVVISPFIGAVCFYFVGWLLYISGKWLKGKAIQAHTRCAFAWSRIPLILDLIMRFSLSFFAVEVFYRVNFNMSFIFINLLTFATSVWAFILLVGAIKEIQRFSLLKAIINVAIVYLIIMFVIFMIIPIFIKIF